MQIAAIVLLAFSTIALRAQSGYTELVPAGPDIPPVAAGPSPWGAGIRLAAKLLGWGAEEGLKASINSKLSSLQPQVDSRMPAIGGGVLVTVVIQQSADPDFNGNYSRAVFDGFVIGGAGSPQAALDNFWNRPQVMASVPDGFVARYLYFWRPAPKPLKGAANINKRHATRPSGGGANLEMRDHKDHSRSECAQLKVF